MKRIEGQAREVSACQLGKMIAKEVESGGNPETALQEMMPTFLRLR